MRVIDILKVFNAKADLRRFSFFVFIQVFFTIIGNVLILKDNASSLVFWCSNIFLLFMIFVYYAFASGYLILTMKNILDENINLPDWFGNIKNIFKSGLKSATATLIQFLLFMIVSFALYFVITNYFVKNLNYIALLSNVLFLFYILLLLVLNLLNFINVARTNSFKSCFKITVFKNEIVKYLGTFILVVAIAFAFSIINKFLTLMFSQTIIFGIIYLLLSAIIVLFLYLVMVRYIAFKHFQAISKNNLEEEKQEVITEEKVEENQEENKGE